MSIVDLIDRDGYLIGRDTYGIETEYTIRDNYVMQIRDADGTIRIISVPPGNPLTLDPDIPIDPEVADIFDVGAII